VQTGGFLYAGKGRERVRYRDGTEDVSLDQSQAQEAVDANCWVFNSPRRSLIGLSKLIFTIDSRPGSDDGNLGYPLSAGAGLPRENLKMPVLCISPLE
jgi:hypothetical protein